jgi:hypothetical protein
MRTMFVEMCLFNVAALRLNNSFIRNRTGEYSAGKEKDRERMREDERERRKRECG